MKLSGNVALVTGATRGVGGGIARELTGQDPASPEFVDHYAEQVRRIIAALAEATPATQDEGSPVNGEPQD